MINKKIFCGMFLLALALSFVYAGSYSSSNPNWGLFKKYEKSTYVDWDTTCEAGQDFVLQIAPSGCIPTVVRSDLLEEQNVPVFCPIQATQVNPLIKVNAIESMSFSGDYPKEVSGLGFHPAQAALGMQTKTNYPILENIGYVVVILKQQENESAMPDYVSGNLTAKIRYDVDNAYGVGKSTLYLPELTDNEFEKESIKNIYSFWDGKFYLRAERIEENYASISIYDDVYKIASVTLGKGETSDELSMPGFDCLAQLKLRLDSLENPGTRVQLKINGDIVEVVEDQKFLDNNCQVTDINKKGLVQKIRIRCYEDDGRKSFTLSIVPKLIISVDGTEYPAEYEEEIGSTGITYNGIETIDGNSDEIDNIKITLTYEKENYKITKDGKTSINNEDVELISYAGGINKDLTTTASENYKNAIEDYDTLINSFSNEICDGKKETCDKYAMREKIRLANEMEQKQDFNEFCEEYEKEFGEDATECSSAVALSSSAPSSTSVLIDSEIKSISLVEILESNFDNYGAEVVVDGTPYELSKDKVVYLKDENGEENEKEFLQLIEIKDEDEVRVNINLLQDDGDYSKGTKTLKEDEAESFDSKHTVELEKINLENYAKVSVIPSIKNVGSSANFSFKIGIEKRAIQLSNEEIQKKIKSLNETINKWSNYNEDLGKVVKTMKTACLATGGFLIAKNFLFNQGESLARKDVTSYWSEKCSDHMSGTTSIPGKEGERYATLDACLADNSDAIDEAVSDAAEAKESTSDIFSRLQEGIKTTNWAGLETVVDDDDVWKKVAEEGLVNDLENDLEKCYPDGIEIKGENVSVSQIKESIKSDYMTITSLRDMIAAAKMCNSNPEFARLELDSSLTNLHVNSESDVNKGKLAKTFGLSSDDITLVADKDAVEYPYKGKTYENIQSEVKINGLADSTPVQVILTTTNKEYIAVLKQSGDKYIIEKLYDKDGKEVSDLSIKNKVYFAKVDENSYKNKFISTKGATTIQIRYYETEPNKGLPAMVPFDLNNGWYVYANQDFDSYDDSAAIRNYYLCNIGKNGKEEAKGGDDTCRSINKGTGQSEDDFAYVSESEVSKLVSCAEQAIIQASRAYSNSGTKVKISTSCGGTIQLDRGKPETSVPSVQCQNYMSPKECQLLFNVCDPVVCPSSRCDFGGEYPVADVIQSGIIGSLVLCLPNWKFAGGDVYIPFCLSGIYAGIDGFISIIKSYRDCLQEKLDSGKTVGVCDEIYSIYLCEFFWKQALPLVKYSLPKIIEAIAGHSTRGGGEYLSFANAWDTAGQSVEYFTNYYGSNNAKLFKVNSVEEVGTEVCKNHISGVGPNVDDMLDSITDPESPVQFHGRFEEEKFTTATVPATSHYKVYYHIYAGTEDSAYYQVYLKGTPENSYYLDSNSKRLVDSGYVGAGDYVSETKDFITTSGYNKMCIRVNNQEECGFKEVSTSAAVDYVTDKYVSSIADETNIQSEDECISGTLLEQLTESEAYEYGIIRICATENPGLGTDASAETEGSRWQEVGYCDKSNNIKCWLDTDSVDDAIGSDSIANSTLKSVSEYYLDLLKESKGASGAEAAIEKLKIDDAQDPDEAGEIIRVIDKHIDNLVMVDSKVTALKLRATAYTTLARQEKAEAEKEDVSDLENCELDCLDAGYDYSEVIRTEEAIKNKEKEVTDLVNLGGDCFCWDGEEVSKDKGEIEEEEDIPIKIPNEVEGELIDSVLCFYFDVGASQEFAAYMTGNLIQESSLDPDATGDSGTAYGIAQWRGSRQDDFRDWARRENLFDDELYTQLRFTLEEDDESNYLTGVLNDDDIDEIKEGIQDYEVYGTEGERWGYAAYILDEMGDDYVSNSNNNECTTLLRSMKDEAEIQTTDEVIEDKNKEYITNDGKIHEIINGVYYIKDKIDVSFEKTDISMGEKGVLILESTAIISDMPSVIFDGGLWKIKIHQGAIINETKINNFQNLLDLNFMGFIDELKTVNEEDNCDPDKNCVVFISD